MIFNAIVPLAASILSLASGSVAVPASGSLQTRDFKPEFSGCSDSQRQNALNGFGQLKSFLASEDIITLQTIAFNPYKDQLNSEDARDLLKNIRKDDHTWKFTCASGTVEECNGKSLFAWSDNDREATMCDEFINLYNDVVVKTVKQHVCTDNQKRGDDATPNYSGFRNVTDLCS